MTTRREHHVDTNVTTEQIQSHLDKGYYGPEVVDAITHLLAENTRLKNTVADHVRSLYELLARECDLAWLAAQLEVFTYLAPEQDGCAS